MKITVLIDNPGNWFNEYINDFIGEMRKEDVEVLVIQDYSQLVPGEIAFFLGCSKIVPKDFLELNQHNIVIIAGNNKDNAKEIINLVKPIVEDNFDYIQGSRYLQDGNFDNTPATRIFSTKVFTYIWKYLQCRTITDASNGFRAYKSEIFDTSFINMNQKWLEGYEFEYYLHYKAINHLKWKEVPVSKIYKTKKNFSKIKIWDSWSLLKPLFLLKLGLRK